MFTEKQIKRFWSHVEVKEKDQCWKWKGDLDKYNYGKVKIQNRVLGSHRVAYSIFYEVEYPESSVNIMHSCDNPRCCNPSHLRKGTFLENMRDRVAKGRGGKSGGGNHIMNFEKASQLRKDFEIGESKHSLARKYGITPQTVREIIRFEIWKAPH